MQKLLYRRKINKTNMDGRFMHAIDIKKYTETISILKRSSHAEGILTIFIEFTIDMLNSVGPVMASWKAV